MQALPSCAGNALPVLCVADHDHASWGSQRDLYPRPLPRSCCSPPLPHRRKVAPLSCCAVSMLSWAMHQQPPGVPAELTAVLGAQEVDLRHQPLQVRGFALYGGA